MTQRPASDVAAVRPSYDGPGVSSIVPALLGAGALGAGSAEAGLEWLPEPVRGAPTVVLLVLDGLGWEAVEAHRELLPTLAALDGGPIPTVVPSTTASALTSITTGVAPSEHGLIGYRVRVDGGVLNALSWQTDGRRGPDPGLVQRREPFRGVDVPVVTKHEFRSSGFTEAHLRGARFEGWRSVSELAERCRRLATAGERLVYAYYPGVDEIAHAHGLHDGYYDAELAFVDRLVGDVLAALPSSATLLVTADHGQVHLGEDAWLPLGATGELVEECSGDGRFRYLHARRGAAADLLAAARDEHSERAWVLSREELLDDGWLGPPPSAVIGRRIGDVVLAARDPVGFVDPELPREAGLRSAHGSLTAAEMLVPLLAGHGGGGVRP
jgi:hypothetical protein